MVERSAFGRDEEAELVTKLLRDRNLQELNQRNFSTVRSRSG